MLHGHLGESRHQQQGDHAADEVAQHDAGSGESDGEPAAEEQACADRAAERDHAELPRREGFLQTDLSGLDVGEFSHGCPSSVVAFG